MKHVEHLYSRPDYAVAMTEQLLRPNALQSNVRSGVFLYGVRRIGKTTFLREDLVPALEAEGALAIYVDLWADPSKNPMTLVLDAVAQTIAQCEDAASSLRARLAALRGITLAAGGISFGFQLAQFGTPGGVTLAQALTELIDKSRTDVVLIIDEVQQAMGSESGSTLMHALKAARDAINTRAGTPGNFLFLGTGSHKSMVSEMVMRRSQPFMGAQAATYEPLGTDFVAWKLDQIRTIPGAVLPSLPIADDGFNAMGHRPEELTKALFQLQEVVARRGLSADQAFPVICDTLAESAADVEIRAIEDLGTLGCAVFDRIASSEDDEVVRLFNQDALGFYAARIGQTVDTSQVQNVVDRLIDSNLLTRFGHGNYRVVDPFVRSVWRRKATMMSSR
jgi:hypothetical protein